MSNSCPCLPETYWNPHFLYTCRARTFVASTGSQIRSKFSSAARSMQARTNSVPMPMFWKPGQTTTSISHFRGLMGNKAVCPTMGTSRAAATRLMPVASISCTHFAQTSSLIGGSPWKQFRG
jgi:hypothetical protein